MAPISSWLGLQPKYSQDKRAITEGSSYLMTGGAEITTREGPQAASLHFEAGTRLALAGQDSFAKHYFCDWILGYVDIPDREVRVKVSGRTIESRGRNQIAAVLGRSPMLYGETIQEALLYRTQCVRKNELFELIERLYGPSLRKRTSAQNPLVDATGKPIPTQSLTTREHLEIAQINVMLQKTPLVVLDLSSELMSEALAEGFRPCREMLESGKTLLVILPPDKDASWAEDLTGLCFNSTLRFD